MVPRTRGWAGLPSTAGFSMCYLLSLFLDKVTVGESIRDFPFPGGNGRRVKFLQYEDDVTFTCVATNIRDIVQYVF